MKYKLYLNKESTINNFRNKLLMNKNKLDTRDYKLCIN